MSLIVTSLNCKYSPVQGRLFVLSKSLDSSDKTCKTHKQKTITCKFILCEPIVGTLHNIMHNVHVPSSTCTYTLVYTSTDYLSL